MHTGTKTLIFEEMFCDETKINTFGGKGSNSKPENIIPIVKHRRGSIMLWRCFAAGGTGILHKIDDIMRKEHRINTLNISQEEVYRQISDEEASGQQSQSFGPHKALISIP